MPMECVLLRLSWMAVIVIRENFPAELGRISMNSTELCEFTPLSFLQKFQLLRLTLGIIRVHYQNYTN